MPPVARAITSFQHAFAAAHRTARIARQRTLAELVRDAHLRSGGPTERLDVQVEPVDAATDRAPGAGRAGILRLPERGLQIDLPRCPRREWRDAYAAILADFLTQAVVLPVGR